MGLFSGANDQAMMTRCIELSRAAVEQGELPFGSLIELDGEVIAEATNCTIRDKDVSRHAEVIALSIAHKSVGKAELARATLYTNVEPCAMCAFCIREAWVGRVVYALSSPVMGGASKWNILRDTDIAKRIPTFGPAPELVSGVLVREAKQAWREWNPIAWEMAKLRGVLTAEEHQCEDVTVLPAHARTAWQHMIFAFMRFSQLGSKRARRV